MKNNQDNNLPVPSDYGHNNGQKNRKGFEIFNCWIPRETRAGFRQYCTDRGLMMQWVMIRILNAVIQGELDDIVYNPSNFKKPSVSDYYEMKKTRRLP